MTWTQEDRLRDVASGLETGEMSRTYAAALLRSLLADVRLARFEKLRSQPVED